MPKADHILPAQHRPPLPSPLQIKTDAGTLNRSLSQGMVRYRDILGKNLGFLSLSTG
ncbi:MAG: hypothetical protein KDJ65_12145 [Anaerolineae bacterium]|nr:hypothetical protein [Anaerolineae bacterium]